MIEFLIALGVFLAAHMVPQVGNLRGRLIEATNRKTYILFYSLLSILLLIWLVSAALRAPIMVFYAAEPGTVMVSMLIMFIAINLFAMGVFRANALSVSFIRVSENQVQRPGILALVRHPIIISFGLWAFAHILVNGEFVNLVLFGFMLAFSLAGQWRMNKSNVQKLAPREYQKAIERENGTWGERTKRAMDRQLAVEIAAGIVAYFSILFAHGTIIGVNPLAYF